jgi:hypothetical protein
MHHIQDLFLEGFSDVLQIDMHFICTSMWTKFYSCKHVGVTCCTCPKILEALSHWASMQNLHRPQ